MGFHLYFAEMQRWECQSILRENTRLSYLSTFNIKSSELLQ